MTAYLTPEEAIENAPADCQEDDVDAFGGKMRVRALTAGQQAGIAQASVTAGRKADVNVALMEMMTFRLGVIEPKMTPEQVRTLHLQSGKSFSRVVARIRELSGIGDEEVATAAAAFPEPEE
ncbi:MAG: hypothetical protein V4703_08215 [Actinomycetota bacterium]